MMDEREEFEAWWNGEEMVRFESDEDLAWQAWQAARASKWRLMDEKAKDGDYYLIGWNDSPYMMVAFFNKTNGHFDDGDFNSRINPPTHYQIITPPPGDK